jgi:hypothetical protein
MDDFGVIISLPCMPLALAMGGLQKHITITLIDTSLVAYPG